MPEDDEIERRLRKLTVDHAETRWLALRLDDDVKEVREELRAVHGVLDEHTARFDSIDSQLQGHTDQLDSIDSQLQSHAGQFDSINSQLQSHAGQFDSINSQLRSLTQLVGQVLERLPDQPRS